MTHGQRGAQILMECRPLVAIHGLTPAIKVLIWAFWVHIWRFIFTSEVITKMGNIEHYVVGLILMLLVCFS